MRSELKVSSRPSEDDVTKGKAFIIKFFFKDYYKMYVFDISLYVFSNTLCSVRGLISAFVILHVKRRTPLARESCQCDNKPQTGFSFI